MSDEATPDLPHAWARELTLNGWSPGDGVTVGIDADGDLGLMDQKGYSIIVAKRDIARLHKWLGEQITQTKG